MKKNTMTMQKKMDMMNTQKNEEIAHVIEEFEEGHNSITIY